MISASPKLYYRVRPVPALEELIFDVESELYVADWLEPAAPE